MRLSFHLTLVQPRARLRLALLAGSEPALPPKRPGQRVAPMKAIAGDAPGVSRRGFLPCPPPGSTQMRACPVPPPSMQAGDTLDTIASSLGLTLLALQGANPDGSTLAVSHHSCSLCHAAWCWQFRAPHLPTPCPSSLPLQVGQYVKLPGW